MTKIEQLEATINQAQQELQELKAESVKKINYWQPKENETYYYVSSKGNLIWSFENNTDNKYRVFKTEIEAEKYAEYIKAEETLREAIAIANDGWLPDWDNFEEKKAWCYKNHTDLYVDYNCVVKSQPSFMYIKSISLAEKLMKDYEAEYLTYLSY